MDRLTERTGEGQAIPRMDLKNNGHQKCMERLAEYEDTGITPGQIREIDRLYAEKCKEIAECRKNQLTGMELANIAAGLKTLREYEGLEEQGKLLKLPCAVGDTVYHLCSFKNRESEIIEMKVGCVEPFGAIRQHRGDYEVWNVYAETDYTKAYFKFSDFGETVFLTQEAAEAALKEMSE